MLGALSDRFGRRPVLLFAIALGIWVLYRIIRGWLALTSQKALT